MTDFAKWDKFDVEKEVEQIDAREDQEAWERQERVAWLGDRRNEAEALALAEDAASRERSRARVAALRARGRGRGSRRAASGGVEATAQEGTLPGATPSDFFEGLRVNLQAVYALRDTAEECMVAQGFGDARSKFQEALRLVADTEQLLDGETQAVGMDEEQMSKYKQAVHSARLAILFGAGKCQMQDELYPEASESLKAFLLLHEDTFEAWFLRGAAFYHMRAPVIADLHWRRIEESPKAPNALRQAVAELRGKTTHKEDPPATSQDVVWLARRATSLAKEALVIFREQFYKTAQNKFVAAVAHLDRARTMANAHTLPLLSEGHLEHLRQSACVNIAACCLLRQCEYMVAVEYCSRVCDTPVPPNKELHLKALLRRAEARKRLGDFRGGRNDLQAAALQCPPGSSELTQVQNRLEHLEFTSRQFLETEGGGEEGLADEDADLRGPSSGGGGSDGNSSSPRQDDAAGGGRG